MTDKEKVSKAEWNGSDNCPYCGCAYKDLFYDIVQEDDGSIYDVVDCPKCGRRLYYEEY